MLERRDAWLTIPLDEGTLDVREDDIVAIKSNGKARSTLFVKGGAEFVVHSNREDLVVQIRRSGDMIAEYNRVSS